jgi:hypothetical protein
VHVVLQLVPRHVYGVQSIVAPFGAISVCCPSHDAASFGTHVWLGALHWNCGSQSPSLAQLAPQPAPPLAHTYGVHVDTTGSGQWPLPSHAAAAVAAPWPHEALRHDVSGPTNALHDWAVTPSQLASLHGLPPVAEAHAGRPFFGAPTTGTQLPGAADVLHASHCPVHGALQQTPSTQNVPSGQGPAEVHASPSFFRAAQRPPSQ